MGRLEEEIGEMAGVLDPSEDTNSSCDALMGEEATEVIKSKDDEVAKGEEFTNTLELFMPTGI